MGKLLCIVGGRLQGLEGAYLAKKAGFETLLVDKSPSPPAAGIADEFYCVDVMKDTATFSKTIRKADAILPCLEEKEVLTHTERAAKKEGIPYLQDNSAFLTTSNKFSFYRLCDRLGVAYPPLIPKASYPLIVKPAEGSGSSGVRMVVNKEELGSDPLTFGGSIVQEYASGEFLSLEMLGLGGKAFPLQITGLEFDETYGCKRVLAPMSPGEPVEKKIKALGARIAKGLSLNGLMDLQVVVRTESEHVEVIESNARLPSQTPTVVFLSTGRNIVELVVDLFLRKKLPLGFCSPKRAVIFQHLIVDNDKAFVGAEHYVSSAKNLRIEPHFHGSFEAITNLPSSGNPNRSVATLMTVDTNLAGAKRRMEEAIISICQQYKVSMAKEQAPWGMVKLYDKIDTQPSQRHPFIPRRLR